MRSYIDLGVAEGADLLIDGRTVALQGYEQGFFLGGTLFDKVMPAMRIYKEEIFGPVLSVVRAGSFDEALDLVNGHECGNGAAIFTRDGDTARAFVSGATAGMIGVNIPIPVPAALQFFWRVEAFALRGPSYP